MSDTHFYAALVDDKKARQVRSETIVLTAGDELFGHELSETCWCHPTVEQMANGRFIIHKRNPEVHGPVDFA